MLASLLLGLAGCRGPAPLRPTAAAPSGVKVGQAAAGAGSPSSSPWIGVTLSADLVTLRAENDGVVTDIPATLGSRVSAGQPLAIIKPTSLEEDLAMARAGQRIAAAEVLRARAEMKQAQDLSARMAALGSYASTEDKNRALYALEAKRAEWQRAQGVVREKAARTKQMRQAVKSSILRAPFAATVVERLAARGAFVQKGTPLLIIVGAGEPFLRFAVAPQEAAQVQPGRPVQVALGSAQKTLRAEVARVSPVVDDASGLIFVEASFLPPQTAVPLGVVAHVGPDVTDLLRPDQPSASP
jgi:RND family efflux transporter MFP subunit